MKKENERFEEFLQDYDDKMDDILRNAYKNSYKYNYDMRFNEYDGITIEDDWGNTFQIQHEEMDYTYNITSSNVVRHFIEDYFQEEGHFLRCQQRCIEGMKYFLPEHLFCCHREFC